MEGEKAEELNQLAIWLQEEGVTPDAPVNEQLCFLWRKLQYREERLATVTHDLEALRQRHAGEMTEVHKSLDQIRTLTEEKDVLAQEIQEENDQLRLQLHRLMLQQDAQINEVAEMLYQEGLSEVIHSNPSEQVAYLLAERASLLERNEGSNAYIISGDTLLGSKMETNAQRQGVEQNPDQSESRQLSSHALRVDQECARLERDVEEGSRRLAMAHKEIRRLTDELESARLTQSAYEPELQRAQEEVEQLRQEVDKLKKRDVVELRKAKELNDRLDQEIRALRTRVRTLDAERRSLQEALASQEQEGGKLGCSLQVQREHLAAQAPDNQTREMAKSQAAELAQSRQNCRRLQEELAAQRGCLAAMETTVHNLEHQLESSGKDISNLTATICAKDKDFLCEKSLWKQKEADLQQEVNSITRMEASLARQDEEVRRLLQEVHNTQSLLHAARQQVALLTEEKLSLQSHVAQLQQDSTKTQTLQQQLKASEQQLKQEGSHLVEPENRNSVAALTKQAKEHKIQRRLWEQREADLQQEVSTLREGQAALNRSNSELSHKARALQLQLEQTQSSASTAKEVNLEKQEVLKQLLATQDECEKLKDELCEALNALDTERSKHHERNLQLKEKLRQAKQKLGDETKWRNEKINHLERELSLSVHSCTTGKQLLKAMTEENEKLLCEKRNLLEQLNEEEEVKNNCVLAASLSKCRVDFLEEENKKLEDRTVHMSDELALLERTLRNMQSQYCAEEMKKMPNPPSVFITSSALQPSSLVPGSSDMRGLLDIIQRSRTTECDDSTSPVSTLAMPLSRSIEMGYLNLTSLQSPSDCLAPSESLSSTDTDEV